ncbi:MAG: ABC transporter substrate-binding protein [Brachybacterium tyrofermentans]|nr:extracellular solute-binding protein [Brachybacterium tyrofermentans]
MKRRTLLTATAASAAAASLAACGSGTPGESKDDAAEADGRTPIEFWHRTFTPFENEWYAGIVSSYNDAQEKFFVKDVEVPADAWDQRVKSAQAAGTMPDVYTDPSTMDEGARLGQFLALDDLLDAEQLENLTDQAKELVTVDGKVYGYPLLLEPQSALFWNKDMFEAAGLDPEKPPTSWDELYATCEKLLPTLPDGAFALTTAGDQDTFAWATVGQQFQVAGHFPITDDWSEADAEDAQYEELLGFYKTLREKGYIPKQPLGAYVEAKAYGEQKCAMMTSGSWAFSEIASDYDDLLGVTGIAPFPTSDGDLSASVATLGNFKWVIDAKTDQPDGAADFLSWCLAGDVANLVPFFVGTQFTKAPARPDVADAVQAAPEAADAPWSAVVSEDIAPASVPTPSYPWDILLAMGKALEKGMNGEDPAKALSGANGEIQKVIDREELAGKAPRD